MQMKLNRQVCFEFQVASVNCKEALISELWIVYGFSFVKYLFHLMAQSKMLAKLDCFIFIRNCTQHDLLHYSEDIFII